ITKGQSKRAAQNAITQLMRLYESRDALKAQIKDLNAALVSENESALDDHAQTITDLAETRMRLKNLNFGIKRKEATL
ncbi:hypothetical protein H0H92_003859, partial [Tricholoma furcatifolium]